MTATTIAWFHPWPSVLLPLATGQGLLAQVGIEIHMNHFHCTLYQVSILQCSNRLALSHCISTLYNIVWACLGVAFQLISLCSNLMTSVPNSQQQILFWKTWQWFQTHSHPFSWSGMLTPQMDINALAATTFRSLVKMDRSGGHRSLEWTVPFSCLD